MKNVTKNDTRPREALYVQWEWLADGYVTHHFHQVDISIKLVYIPFMHI